MKSKSIIQKIYGRLESGQAIVFIVIVLYLIFIGAVGAIDYGTYIRARQRLEVTVDAAVLAGGLELPRSGTNATSKALEYININDPDVDFADVTTTFRCLVGDRDHNGSPDPEDIPAVCNPGTGASFSCSDGLCISNCAFTGSNTCNVMAVTANKDVPLIFTRTLGLPPVNITASRTGSCKGLCGEPPRMPLDVIIVLDRTGSMSSSELTAAKNGAKTVLQIFDPEEQHIGLAVLGAGRSGYPCQSRDPEDGGNWLVVPLSDDYKNPDGSLNTSSQLVSTINCLQTSSQGTNLGSPLSDNTFDRPDAWEELKNSGRDVTQGVILFTDGAANEPTNKSCKYAYNRANVLKENKGVEIFTIGYGVETERCIDSNGTYANEYVTQLLADMATDSLDDHGHCRYQSNVDQENADGDHFLCMPKGGDLNLVFRIAAEALSTNIKLISFPD